MWKRRIIICLVSLIFITEKICFGEAKRYVYTPQTFRQHEELWKEIENNPQTDRYKDAFLWKEITFKYNLVWDTNYCKTWCNPCYLNIEIPEWYSVILTLFYITEESRQIIHTQQNLSVRCDNVIFPVYPSISIAPLWCFYSSVFIRIVSQQNTYSRSTVDPQTQTSIMDPVHPLGIKIEFSVHPKQHCKKDVWMEGIGNPSNKVYCHELDVVPEIFLCDKVDSIFAETSQRKTSN